MAFLSQRIDRSKLVPGDHIYTWRNAFVYAHHGIYIRDGEVVHLIGAVDDPSRPNSQPSFCFNKLGLDQTGCPNSPHCGSRKPGSGVMISCLDCFLSNGSLYRFGYGVSKFGLLLQVRSGTCTAVQSDPPEEVIYRALYLHEHGFQDYDIILNNCEHFAMYCKTQLVCTLGATGQASVFQVPITMAATCKSLRWLMPAAGTVTLTAAAIGSYMICRLSDDLGSRDGVKKIPVEVVAVLCGLAGNCSGSFTSSPPNDQPESAELEKNQHLVETESSASLLKNSLPTADNLATTTVQFGSFTLNLPNDHQESAELEKKQHLVETESSALLLTNSLPTADNLATTTIQFGSFTVNLQPESAELEENQHLVETESSAMLLTNSPGIADVQLDIVGRESREPVVVGPLVSSIDEIIKGLEKPAVAARANELVLMEETHRSWAKRIKDDFVKELVVMDPLVPGQMVSFANSSLKLLSRLPFDVDSLYLSVKNFIIQAYELANAKRDLHARMSDFNTLVENTRDRIQALTEERNCLEKLSSEAKQDLKAIGDQNEAASGSQINAALKMEREHKDPYFQSVKNDLEKTSKELRNTSKLMEELEVAAIFRDAEKQEISKGLAELEVALEDGRAQLLS